MPKLYEQTAVFADLLKRFDEDEFSELSQADIDSAFASLEVKVENVAGYIKDLEGEALKFKAEAERLASKTNALSNRAKWFKNYLKGCLEAANIKRAIGGIHTVRIQANGAAAVAFNGKSLSELAKVNPDFVRVVPEALSLNSDGVLAAIKAKPDLELPEGLTVVRGTHLRIA